MSENIMVISRDTWQVSEINVPPLGNPQRDALQAMIDNGTIAVLTEEEAASIAEWDIVHRPVGIEEPTA